MTTFIGVDLGWYGKPSGLASIVFDQSELRLRHIARLEGTDEILGWIQAEAGSGSAVAAVDAPLVIRNATGIRAAESELNRDFRRFHAGCHAANLGRPFAQKVISFSRALEAIGFGHGALMRPREDGQFQIEVHPHAATVRLFGLDRIVKYKRGTRDERARGLRRLRALIKSRLPVLDPGVSVRLPLVPATGSTKPVEDRIDAVLCAYIAAHWWFWGIERNRVYGTQTDGYIVVPQPRVHCGLDDIDDPLQCYLRELDKIPALTADEEINLLERMRTQDDEGELARKSLIEAHLHLVVPIALRHPPAGIHVLDLIMKGNEALMHSLTTFAGGSGERFSAHTAACIERAILDAISESPTDLPRRG